MSISMTCTYKSERIIGIKEGENGRESERQVKRNETKERKTGRNRENERGKDEC